MSDWICSGEVMLRSQTQEQNSILSDHSLKWINNNPHAQHQLSESISLDVLQPQNYYFYKLQLALTFPGPT